MWQISVEDKGRLEKAIELLDGYRVDRVELAHKELRAIQVSMMSLAQYRPSPEPCIVPLSDGELRKAYPERYPLVTLRTVCGFCGNSIQRAGSRTGWMHCLGADYTKCGHIAEPRK